LNYLENKTVCKTTYTTTTANKTKWSMRYM